MIAPLAPRTLFPALVADPALAYLDSAATSLRPAVVIEAVTQAMIDAGPVHRAGYARAVGATTLYERARAAVAAFLETEPEQVVFVRGATEALSAVARSCSAGLGPGDEILVTALEHHANLWPWQAAARASGAELIVAPAPSGVFDAEAFVQALSPRTRIVALAQVTNAFGTPLPVARLVAAARAQRRDVVVVVDGAQAVAHQSARPLALGADFYVFSAHKLYGPGGLGVLWAREPERLAPWLLGGGLAERGPRRLEAGSPDPAAAAGLIAALGLVDAFGWEAILAHERSLMGYAEAALRTMPGVRLLGAAPRVGALAFVLRGVHAHDVATFCDEASVAVRAGHHCAEPAHLAAGVGASCRLSLGLYTSSADLDRVAAAVARAAAVLGPGGAK